MPPVAIHDLRVQPVQHDLIAGTHGRGIWVLDDVTPIEQLARARRSASPTLFPARTSFTWYQWWTSQYGMHDDECCVPAGEFSGENPPYGALISYYLPRAVRSARIDVTDGAGHVIRSLPVDGSPGLHRISWDLALPAPVRGLVFGGPWVPRDGTASRGFWPARRRFVAPRADVEPRALERANRRARI